MSVKKRMMAQLIELGFPYAVAAAFVEFYGGSNPSGDFYKGHPQFDGFSKWEIEASASFPAEEITYSLIRMKREYKIKTLTHYSVLVFNMNSGDVIDVRDLGTADDLSTVWDEDVQATLNWLRSGITTWEKPSDLNHYGSYVTTSPA